MTMYPPAGQPIVLPYLPPKQPINPPYPDNTGDHAAGPGTDAWSTPRSASNQPWVEDVPDELFSPHPSVQPVPEELPVEWSASMPVQSASDDFRGGRAPGPNDIFIAVMGLTGSGKSSFISLCSGKSVKIGHDLNACTATVDVYPYDVSPGKTVYLIDTPGFDDTTRSDTEVLTEIATWLGASYRNKILLSGIVYLHRITDIRMQGSARKNLMMFKQLCGQDAFKKVILITTMWDKVSPDDGTKREKELVDTPEFWGWMMSKGSKCCRHNNNADSARSIIEQLSSSNERVTTSIQRELVDERRELGQTSAGQEVHSELMKERKKWAEERRQIEADMKEAIRQRDTEMEQMLREERDRYTKKIQKVEEDTSSLRINMQNLLAERDSRIAKMEAEMRSQQATHRDQLLEIKKHQAAAEERSKALHAAELKRVQAAIEAQQRVAAEAQERAARAAERAEAERIQAAKEAARAQMEREERAHAEEERRRAAHQAEMLRLEDAAAREQSAMAVQARAEERRQQAAHEAEVTKIKRERVALERKAREDAEAAARFEAQRKAQAAQAARAEAQSKAQAAQAARVEAQRKARVAEAARAEEAKRKRIEAQRKSQAAQAARAEEAKRKREAAQAEAARAQADAARAKAARARAAQEEADRDAKRRAREEEDRQRREESDARSRQLKAESDARWAAAARRQEENSALMEANRIAAANIVAQRQAFVLDQVAANQQAAINRVYAAQQLGASMNVCLQHNWRGLGQCPFPHGYGGW